MLDIHYRYLLNCGYSFRAAVSRLRPIPSSHFIESLNADKHVFCEKPIGHDIKTVDSVYALAKEKNKYMLTGMYSFLSSSSHC